MSKTTSKQYPSVGLYLACLNPRYFIPDVEITTVGDLQSDKMRSELNNRGIKAMIFDVDETLVTNHRGFYVQTDVADTINYLKNAGIRLGLLSNEQTPRNTILARHFDILAIPSEIRKPHPLAFKMALEYLAAEPHETAMVGDRPWIDMAGAKHFDPRIYTIRVKPVNPESAPRGLRTAMAFENALLRLYTH